MTETREARDHLEDVIEYVEVGEVFEFAGEPGARWRLVERTPTTDRCEPVDGPGTLREGTDPARLVVRDAGE